MRDQLPPGPPYPSAMQTLGWWSRPVAFLERCRTRHGKRFTIRLLGTPPFVMLSDPEEIKELFTAPPEILHPGEGARILEPVVGRNSVILLDEDRHLEQRKLMLPAFHGERMERLTGLMTEVSEREAARWPLDEPVALHPASRDSRSRSSCAPSSASTPARDSRPCAPSSPTPSTWACDRWDCSRSCSATSAR